MASYCTTAELKGWLRVTDPTDDSLIGAFGTAASAAVDDYCGRSFGSAAGSATRTYQAEDSGLVYIDDLAGTAGVIVKTDDDGDGTYETTWDSANLTWEPRDAETTSAAYWRLRTANGYRFTSDVQVTADWGWTATPEQVKLAVRLQVARWYKRRDAPFGVVSFPEAGQTERLGAQLDPDVRLILGPLRRHVL